MIIELTGPPGAGKSTVVKKLLELPQEDGLLLLSKQEALGVAFRRHSRKIPLSAWLRRPLWYSMMAWNIMAFLLKHFVILRIVLASQWGRPISWRLRLWLLKIILKQLGQHRLLHRFLNPNEAVVIDGGAVHSNVTLFTSEKVPHSFHTLKRYVQCLPPPDLLIVLKVPLELCVMRVMNRKRSLPVRLQELSPELITSFVRHQAEAVAAAARIAQCCGWRVLVVDNTGSLAEVLNQIRELLRNLEKASLKAR